MTASFASVLSLSTPFLWTYLFLFGLIILLVYCDPWKKVYSRCFIGALALVCVGLAGHHLNHEVNKADKALAAINTYASEARAMDMPLSSWLTEIIEDFELQEGYSTDTHGIGSLAGLAKRLTTDKRLTVGSGEFMSGEVLKVQMSLADACLSEGGGERLRAAVGTYPVSEEEFREKSIQSVFELRDPAPSYCDYFLKY